MSLKFYGRITLLFLLASSTVCAHTNTPLRCPAIEKIQQGAPKLNKVGVYRHTYYVDTSEPAFSDSGLEWKIEVFGIYAKSEEDAIVAAKRMAETTSYHKNEYPEEMNNGMFFCFYGPSIVKVMGTKSKTVT